MTAMLYALRDEGVVCHLCGWSSTTEFVMYKALRMRLPPKWMNVKLCTLTHCKVFLYIAFEAWNIWNFAAMFVETSVALLTQWCCYVQKLIANNGFCQFFKWYWASSWCAESICFVIYFSMRLSWHFDSKVELCNYFCEACSLYFWSNAGWGFMDITDS